MSSACHISLFNSDTGSRDLGSERSFPRETPEYVIIKTAIELARKHGGNAVTVVRTKPYGSKPGAWYIKGFKNRFSYEELRSKIDENIILGKFARRECWLIRV
jgi:hypothetical protein